MSVFFTRRGPVPYLGKMLSDYAIGESVFLNVNGILREFRVVNHGIPSGSSIYDSSCDGSWLMMKEACYYHSWDEGNTNNYKLSDMNTYLNNDFLAMFEPDVQNTIKQVKIPYGRYDSSTSLDPLVNSGANGADVKIFLPSTSELGYDHGSGVSYHARDGANLSYFKDTSSTGADEKRVIVVTGTSDDIWWTRTCWGGSENFVYYVNDAGKFGYHGAGANHYILPMMIMPSETKFHAIHNTFLEA